ncbi:MAG: alpha/beta hydrolase family protein, partial [Nevskiales bacterium]
MSHTHLDGRLLTPSRRSLLALPSALGGLLWLLAGYGLGGGWQVLCMLLGLATLGTAAVILWQPLGRRAPQLVSLIAVLDFLFTLPMLWPLSVLWWFLLLASAVATYLASGYLSLLRVRIETGMPAIDIHWRQALKAAADEAVLGYFVGTVAIPRGDRLARIARECREGLEWFGSRGFLDNPAGYHRAPPALTDFRLDPRSGSGFQYQRLLWPSAYVPANDEPGAARWLAYTNTQTAHARIFQHAGGPRPWLICIHGYRMGWRWIDFRLFQPAWLHHALGLNLALPTLPLHGQRRLGMRSGDGFMDGDLMDIIHAEAQAQWDLRR